jgi:ATP phosphoribosyltransferase
VRAADVPEYVQDGVVDCGVTGADLVRERGVRVQELLRLGFGGCTLEAAVPAEAPTRTLDELAGLRVATVYPRLARELLAERGVDVSFVDVTGSVEVAPRLGLADAIVDLVSTGHTLKANDLEPVEEIMPVSARLIVNQAALKTKRAALQPLIDAFAKAAAK